MHVRRIDHVNIRTDLIDESSAFYERLLRLRRTNAPGMDPARIAWLCDDAAQPIIHLNAPPEGEPVGSGEDTGRLHHLAFDCTGYDAALATLGEMGCPFETNHYAEIDLRQIFVLDPNGLRLELNFRS